MSTSNEDAKRRAANEAQRRKSEQGEQVQASGKSSRVTFEEEEENDELENQSDVATSNEGPRFPETTPQTSTNIQPNQLSLKPTGSQQDARVEKLTEPNKSKSQSSEITADRPFTQPPPRNVNDVNAQPFEEPRAGNTDRQTQVSAPNAAPSYAASAHAKPLDKSAVHGQTTDSRVPSQLVVEQQKAKPNDWSRRATEASVATLQASSNLSNGEINPTVGYKHSIAAQAQSNAAISAATPQPISIDELYKTKFKEGFKNGALTVNTTKTESEIAFTYKKNLSSGDAANVPNVPIYAPACKCKNVNGIAVVEMHSANKDTIEDRQTKLTIMVLVAKQGFGNQLQCPNKISESDALMLSKAAKENGVGLIFSDSDLQNKYGVQGSGSQQDPENQERNKSSPV